MTRLLPDEVLLAIEEELRGINFGKIILEISVHDKRPKFRIIKEVSIVPGKFTSGQKKKGAKNE